MNILGILLIIVGIFLLINPLKKKEENSGEINFGYTNFDSSSKTGSVTLTDKTVVVGGGGAGDTDDVIYTTGGSK